MKSIFLLGLLAIPSSFAILASPDSSCASLCIDNPALSASSLSSFTTTSADLTCNDSVYNKTEAGKAFKQCVSCLQESTSSGDGMTDQRAFLYNLKATLAACLFSYPNATNTTTSSACVLGTSCGPLQSALEAGILNAATGTGYEYCNASFSQDVIINCVQCFQASDDQEYLANFLIALEAGCQQKPPAGKIMALSGTVFQKNQITIGSPDTVVEAPKAGPPFPIGAIIGIVFVVVIAVAVVITIVLIRRRRKQRRETTNLKTLNQNYDERYGALGISGLAKGFNRG